VGGGHRRRVENCSSKLVSSKKIWGEKGRRSFFKLFWGRENFETKVTRSVESKKQNPPSKTRTLKRKFTN